MTQLLREFSIQEVDLSIFVIETVRLHFIGGHGRVCYLISSTEWHHNMLVVNTKIIHH